MSEFDETMAHGRRPVMSWPLVACQNLVRDTQSRYQDANSAPVPPVSLFPEVPLTYQRCDGRENATLVPESPQFLAAKLQPVHDGSELPLELRLALPLLEAAPNPRQLALLHIPGALANGCSSSIQMHT